LRLTSVLSLLLLAGCPPIDPIVTGGEDSDTDMLRPCVDAESDGCPCGLVATDTATLVFSTLQVEGLAVFIEFDPDTTVNDGDRDRPSACISTDATEASLIFSIAGSPAGRVDLEAVNGTGSYGVAGDDVEATLDLYAYTPPTTITKEQWSSGEVAVLTAGPSLLEANLTTASGTGTGNRIVTVAMQMTASTP